MKTPNTSTDSTGSAQALPEFTSFKVRVLLIDDQAIVAEAVRRMLVDQPDIEFHYVTDPALALQVAQQLKPTVILQDLVMPQLDGFKLLTDFREHQATKEIPIVVLSSREDPQLKVQAFSGGASDYLVKLPDKLELVARIHHHSRAYISRLERDEAFRFLRESQQKLAQANIALEQLIALDGLTGIANRRRLDEYFASEWQRALRGKTEMSVLMCDIDNFKLYNDGHGHQAGDLCLRKVSAVLTENLKRPSDLVARYGGEEFALVLPETSNEGAMAVAESCRRGVEALALLHAPQHAGKIVTISIGVASVVASKAIVKENLIAAADHALYRAKDAGRNQVVMEILT